MPNENPAINKLIEKEEHRWLLLKIFSYLSLKDIASVSRVSTLFLGLANNQKLWSVIGKEVNNHTYPFLWNKYLKPSEDYKAIVKVIKKAEKEAAGVFSIFPAELLIEIFLHFNAKELATISRVSRFFKYLAENDHLWAKLLNRKWRTVETKHHLGKSPKAIFQKNKEEEKKLKILFLQQVCKETYTMAKFEVLKYKPFQLSFLNRFTKPNTIKQLVNLCSNSKYTELALFLKENNSEIEKWFSPWDKNNSSAKEALWLFLRKNAYEIGRSWMLDKDKSRVDGVLVHFLLIHALNNPDKKIFAILVNYLNEIGAVQKYVNDIVLSSGYNYFPFVYILVDLITTLREKLVVKKGSREPLIYTAISSDNLFLMKMLVGWDPACVTYSYRDEHLQKVFTPLSFYVHLNNSVDRNRVSIQRVSVFYPVLKYYPHTVFEIADLILGDFSDYAAKLFACLDNEDVLAFRTKTGLTLLNLSITIKPNTAMINFIVQMFKELLNIPNNDGQTPLMLLCKSEGETIEILGLVQVLVNAGAHIDCTDKFGLTALNYAIQKGHLEIQAYLEQQLGINRAAKKTREILIPLEEESKASLQETHDNQQQETAEISENSSSTPSFHN